MQEHAWQVSKIAKQNEKATRRTSGFTARGKCLLMNITLSDLVTSCAIAGNDKHLIRTELPSFAFKGSAFLSPQRELCLFAPTTCCVPLPTCTTPGEPPDRSVPVTVVSKRNQDPNLLFVGCDTVNETASLLSLRRP